MKALGATVTYTTSFLSGKQKEIPHIILVDSLSFPPHSTATHPRITKVMNSVPSDVPVIDFTWVVQSIVQRRCLDFDDDKRYRVNVKSHVRGSLQIYLLKVKTKEISIRYEVGDTVKVSKRGSKVVSYARIMAMRVEGRNRNLIDLQLLVSINNYMTFKSLPIIPSHCVLYFSLL